MSHLSSDISLLNFLLQIRNIKHHILRRGYLDDKPVEMVDA